MHHVYILKSRADGKLYIGSTSYMSKRLHEHNAGRVKSTKSRIPFKLVYYKKFNSSNKARYFEWKVKHSVSAKKKFLLEAGIISNKLQRWGL